MFKYNSLFQSNCTCFRLPYLIYWDIIKSVMNSFCSQSSNMCLHAFLFPDICLVWLTCSHSSSKCINLIPSTFLLFTIVILLVYNASSGMILFGRHLEDMETSWNNFSQHFFIPVYFNDTFFFSFMYPWILLGFPIINVTVS